MNLILIIFGILADTCVYIFRVRKSSKTFYLVSIDNGPTVGSRICEKDFVGGTRTLINDLSSGLNSVRCRNGRREVSRNAEIGQERARADHAWKKELVF